MPGVGIVLNPHSRSNRLNPGRVNRLGFIVGDKGSCHATQDVLDVERIAQEFKERGVEVLGISGGDGTNHCTLTSFIKVYGDSPLPKIAFLRGGTMNNVSNCLGIQGTPEQILSNLIQKYDAHESFKTTDLDLMSVNGEYGFLFGMGVVERFLTQYYKAKGSPARAGFLLGRTVLAQIFRTPFVDELFERFDSRVTVDGVEWPYKNYNILHAGTVETYGLGFDPFYRAREKPGFMHFVGLSATPVDVGFALPKVWMRKPTHCENELGAVCQRVVIEMPEPQLYFIDGDIKPATTRIEVACDRRLTCIVN